MLINWKISPAALLLLFFLLAIVYATGCYVAGPAVPVSPTLSSIQTSIFSKSCTAPNSCHGGSDPKALLNLEAGKAYRSLMEKIQNDTAAKYYVGRVVARRPESSFLIAKLRGALRTQEGDQMPDKVNAIPSQYIDVIERWILNGAQND